MFLLLHRVHPDESWETFFCQTVGVSVHPTKEAAIDSANGTSGSNIVIEAKLCWHDCLDPKEYKRPTRVYMKMPKREQVREWFERYNNCAKAKAEIAEGHPAGLSGSKESTGTE